MVVKLRLMDTIINTCWQIELTLIEKIIRINLPD